MAPLPLLLVIALALSVPLAWFKGGRPERAAVAAILVTWSLSLILKDAHIGRCAYGRILADLSLLCVLSWLAFRYDRWWLLAATAAQSLALTAHFAVTIRPELTESENQAVLAVFQLLCLATLSAGVVERWLAGERAAAPPLDTRRVKVIQQP